MTGRPEKFLSAAMMALGLLCGLFLLAELITIAMIVPKSPNEGWNAYHQAHAFIDGARALYPSKQSLFFNNYPPLSYFIVGALALVTQDAIIAGRIVSLISVIGIAVCLGLTARAMGCRRRESVFAGILFLAAPWVLGKLTAMNDPQMLGNFLDAIALLVIVRAPASMAHVALAALFLTCAEYVKPLYIVLPLALMAWLWIYHRRSAFALAGFGLAFGLLGLLACKLILGINLLEHLFSPRVFTLSKMAGQPGQWLLTEALPLVASISLFRHRGRDSFSFLAAAYALCGFVLSIYFSGGEGVSASQTIDASMAVALGSAVFLDRQIRFTTERRAVAAFAVIASLQAVILILSFLGKWSSRPSIPELLAERPLAAADIAFTARQNEPVFCETLAFCYWAGKSAQVDTFGMGEAFQKGARREADMIALFDAHHFSMVQLSYRSSFSYSPALMGAVARDYRLDHRDAFGFFYLPRR